MISHHEVLNYTAAILIAVVIIVSLWALYHAHKRIDKIEQHLQLLGKRES